MASETHFFEFNITQASLRLGTLVQRNSTQYTYFFFPSSVRLLLVYHHHYPRPCFCCAMVLCHGTCLLRCRITGYTCSCGYNIAVGSNGDPKLSPMSSAQNIVQKIFCQILAHRSYALSVTWRNGWHLSIILEKIILPGHEKFLHLRNCTEKSVQFWVFC